MTKWKCIYQGQPDSKSASGHAAPSWDNFDQRVWTHPGGYRLTLINLYAGRVAKRPPGKITEYQVTLRTDSQILEVQKGSDWQKLVRDVKATIEREPETPPLTAKESSDICFALNFLAKNGYANTTQLISRIIKDSYPNFDPRSGWAKSVGEKVKFFAQKLDMTPEQLVERLELTAEALQLLLANRLSVDAALAQRLASTFGVMAEFWLQAEHAYRIRCSWDDSAS